MVATLIDRVRQRPQIARRMTRNPSESSAITQNRRELKFKLDESHAAMFSASVAARIPKHRFQDLDANRLPRARHYITTAYFDTSARDLYRAACDNPGSLKIRAREYYDEHPELLDVATDIRDVVRCSPVAWIEVKGKRDGHTYKRRVGIPKADIEPFFECGVVSPAMHDLQSISQPARELIAELVALRKEFSEPLRASCLVNYRRTAFEDPAGTLRITFDQHMACFAPPYGLWSNGRPLVREALGAPVYLESCYVLEVKARVALPDWLAELLQRVGAEEHGLSKFRTASEKVHGPMSIERSALHPHYGCIAR
jgi:hypothetical protein